MIKKENNVAQSTLDKDGREQNVKNVYQLQNSKKIMNKNILLIDDILTTGATVNECSKILNSAGASRIDILTIAKD